MNKNELIGKVSEAIKSLNGDEVIRLLKRFDSRGLCSMQIFISKIIMDRMDRMEEENEPEFSH